MKMKIKKFNKLLHRCIVLNFPLNDHFIIEFRSLRKQSNKWPLTHISINIELRVNQIKPILLNENNVQTVHGDEFY